MSEVITRDPLPSAEYERIFAVLDTVAAAPTLGEVESTLLEHVQALHEFYGEVMGVRIARKHVGWYLATLPGARDFRARFNHLEDRDAQGSSIRQFFAEQRSGPGSVDGTEVAA